MRSASCGAEFQPFVEHGGFVLGLLVAFDLLQPGGDVGLVHLVQFGERAFLAAVFFLQFGYLGGDAFQLGRELVDGLLLLGEVAGDDEGLGHEVAGPALVLLLALLVLLDDAVGLGLPAVGGDQVAVVLHGLRPVVHQVLIDVVVVDQRLAGVVGKQVFGERGDDFLRVAAGLQRLERLGALLPPAAKWAFMLAMKAANSGCS